MTSQEMNTILGDAAQELAKLPELAGVIVIGITNHVTDDDTKRRSLMALAVKSEINKYPLYLEMGIESLKKAIENGPVIQSTPM
jgi:hypothetical protein